MSHARLVIDCPTCRCVCATPKSLRHLARKYPDGRIEYLCRGQWLTLPAADVTRTPSQ